MNRKEKDKNYENYFSKIKTQTQCLSFISIKYINKFVKNILRFMDKSILYNVKI